MSWRQRPRLPSSRPAPPAWWSREMNRIRVSVPGHLVNQSPAGIRHPHDFGALVIGLTGSIIDRSAEGRVAAETFDMVQMGVAAGYDQRQKRKLHRPFKKGCEQMPFYVMYADKRNFSGDSNRLGCGETDQKSPGQTGPPGNSDPLQSFHADAGVPERLTDHRRD